MFTKLHRAQQIAPANTRRNDILTLALQFIIYYNTLHNIIIQYFKLKYYRAGIVTSHTYFGKVCIIKSHDGSLQTACNILTCYNTSMFGYNIRVLSRSNSISSIFSTNFCIFTVQG